MQVIIVGGTGALGGAIGRSLLAAGHVVTLVGRHAPAALAPGARFVTCDVDAADDASLRETLAGHDGLVYALGPDDRTPAPRPVEAWFMRHLADRTARIVTAARQAGVGRAVVLGSYFADCTERFPDLTTHHPYVRARLAQAQRAFAAGGSDLRVSVLGIPYVWTDDGGRPQDWQATLYRGLPRLPVIGFPGGASTMATSTTVVDAAVAALGRGRHGVSYPVGDADLTWAEALGLAADVLNPRAPRRPLPRVVGALLGPGMHLTLALRGKGSGLTPRWVVRDLFERDLVADHAATGAELAMAARDVRTAITSSAELSRAAREPSRPPRRR